MDKNVKTLCTKIGGGRLTKRQIILLAVLLVVVLLWKLIFGRRRYRYGRRVGFSRRGSYRGRRRR